ncbi:6871_t:CDS:2 [Funneliformis geosporum]|nr:6871_t:CDS:2 [Funneliformis geosporum]
MIGYLRRVGDRFGERVITFNPTVLSNDYIKTAASSYPEMLACHSPNICMSGNDYFNSKSIMCGVAGSPISGDRHRTMNHSNRNMDINLTQVAKEDSSFNNENGDSDEDIDVDDEDNSKQPLFTKLRLPKQIVTPPPVFVTSPSKPPTSRPSLVAQSFSPSGDALKTSPDSILGISSTEQTPQLSPTTSAESDRVLAAERRGSEASLLTTDGTEIPSSPPPRPSLSATEERKFLPDSPKIIPKPKPFSALTALIAEKKSKLDNPFVEEYSFFAGKGDLKPLTLKIFLPFSNKPLQPLVVVVKSDASVEEVIGYTLYQYWDEKREPALESKLCDVLQWTMRIVEDDGEIDYDFPVPDRTRKISKFATDQFALCKANPNQVKQNEAVSAKSRPPTKESLSNTSLKSNGTIVHAASSTTTAPSSASAAVSAIDLTNQIFLRIRLTPNSEVAHTTTINVSADMHFYDVLEMVCRKRKLDPKDYTFKIADTNNYINLEKTVESIGNSQELSLVQKQSSNSSSNTVESPTSPTRSKRRITEPPQPQYVSSNEYMSVYKKYTVNRKIPMFVGRHERVLAIDGDYIHIMPSETRTMFESMKTSSYHITDVISCKTNKKAPLNFKLEIYRDSGTKTYDFEAESAKLATEICQKVKFLVGLYNSDKSRAKSTLNH